MNVLKLSLIVLFLSMIVPNASALPMFEANADGAKVILYDDPCQVPAVTNLKFRATWEENGKVIEGCWGPRPDVQIVVMYFTDLTAGVAPIRTFKRLTNV